MFELEKEEQCSCSTVGNRSVKREEDGEDRGPGPRASYTRVRNLGFILSTS